MQVSVETVSEIGRKMTVQIPEDQIRAQVEKRLRSLNKKVKIDGFRPGKAPENVVRQRYGSSVRLEVLEEVIQNSFNDAVRSEKLIPASAPEIEPENLLSEEGLRYVASFEVMPEIKVTGLEQLSLQRYVSEVTENDVDAMIVKLREQRQTWEEVNRPAQMGDSLLVNMEGHAGEQDLTGGKVEKMPLVLGAGRFIPGFEDKLLGAIPGETRSFDMVFPDDYGNADLAGKTGSFTVDVLTVSAPVPAELNQEFYKAYGVEQEGFEAFRDAVRSNMMREMHRALKKKTKDALMDSLSEAHAATPLPQALIAQEIAELLKPKGNSKRPKLNEEGERELRKLVEPYARKRVLLGCIIDQVIENEQLEPDEAQVRSAVEDTAAGYENPEQVVNWYYSNPKQLRNFEALVLEDQVVDLILSKANASEQSVDFLSLIESTRQAA